MALFGGKRDRKFIASLNAELLNAVVDTEIEFFKLSLKNTKTNIYGESIDKQYYSSILVPSLILKDDKQSSMDEYGHTYNRTIQFALSREIIWRTGMEPEVGDIVFWDNEYYELDNVDANQYWLGKNEETAPTNNESGNNNTEDHGYSVSTICDAHVTRLTQHKIKKLRSGGTTNINEYEGH